MFNVVLIEPEIPPNTGNIARLCLATRSRLHLVEPLGFSVNDRQLRRAGMDYWHLVDVQYWKSLAEFETVTRPPKRRFLLTTKSTRKYWEAKFREGDYLVFGRETKGLPESLLLSNAENCLTIPMVSDARSLNLATAVAIVLFEGIRQIHCDGD
ncbi:MAG: tRNA (uridine(34)/cytosine(34)/5-carboxymethylaminomethyluridine(34)-2'-O)-methyltransferase TrmL [Verrucomicrobia bacterium]|nr:tRNA (uridine(34)/cytosine(34)/5-carboxymethylaminomethyluridine(34)-2'-O)-methyltransferase TrmL [Verrucomicrobiota bacterium]MBV9645672.1 tRNA (uridine(34)/cytosine(34)/5-carboxymethylaminomethyluridine(34)-2'-O)-methyltransferase TrmL [Verrucomicrobiota bacterium]